MQRANLKRNRQTLFHLLKLYHKGIYKVICIIIASISITLISMYFFLCGINIALNVFGDISTLKRTYMFRFDENSEFEVLTGVLSDLQKYPDKINHILVYTTETSRVEEIKLVFPRKLNFYNKEDDSFHLIEGRYFSKKEIEEGSNVIILNYLVYRNNYPENTIGDIITYGGIDFKLIGIHDTINDSRILLLYNTFAKAPGSMEEAGIRIGDIDLEFSEKLSNPMINKIEEKFYEGTGNPIIVKSSFRETAAWFAYDVFRYVFIIILIFILFTLCIRQLYSIVDGMNQHKYDVLLRVGMDEGMWKLTRFIGIEVCMLISYIISIIFFYGASNIISKTGFHASLPIWSTMLIFALFQGILLLRIIIQRIQWKKGGKGQNEKKFTAS